MDILLPLSLQRVSRWLYLLWSTNMSTDVDAKGHLISPALLFVLVNLVMVTLIVINNPGFFIRTNNMRLEANQGNEINNREAGCLHDIYTDAGHDGHLKKREQLIKNRAMQQNSGAISVANISSISDTTARELPPRGSNKTTASSSKQLSRSKFEHKGAAAMASFTSSITKLDVPEQDKTPAQSHVKKTKKKAPSHGLSDHAPPVVFINPGDRSNAINAGGGAIREEEVKYNVVEEEVDRRAEDFIAKFYLRMKMQRLESLQRYNQHMDRSYGR